ncbi:RDD family protein [[Eubacterium] hominis]|uniref:RDD family protein n=1 Tax=[Eubacterium] hominis TaxID=2764325 RepID=UPI003A4E18AB
MEQTLKETKSIRVKWYYKIFAKLDNEKTTVDTTNRVFAYIIDWVLGTFVTAFPTVFMYMSLTKSTEVNQNLLTFPSYYGFIAGGLSLLFALFYYVYVPLKVHKGQTYGKKFMDIKIVKLDGSDVDAKTMLKREALGRFILEASLVSIGGYLFQLVTLATQIDLVMPLTCVSAVLCILSMLLAIKSDSKRMLHDYIGKTKLVTVEKQN